MTNTNTPNPQPFNETHEDMFVEFALFSKDFYEDHRDAFDPDLFDSDRNKKIVANLNRYYQSYNLMPEREILQSGAQVSHVGAPNFKCHNGNLPWAQTEIARFFETRKMERALKLAADAHFNGNTGQIATIIEAAADRTLTPSSNGLTNLETDLDEMIAEMNSISENKLSSGWRQIDRIMEGGFAPGELNIGAAKSGNGKSLYLCNQAVNLAEQGKKVLFITLEMTNFRIMARLGQMHTGFRSNDPQQLGQMAIALRSVECRGNIDVKFLDRSASAHTIDQVIKQSKKEYDAVVVDYMDLLKPIDASISQELKFYADDLMSYELRQLAIRHNVALFTASQLNRSRGVKKPGDTYEMEDIAGGFSKIQNADNCFVIERLTNAEEIKADAKARGGDSPIPPKVIGYKIYFVKVRNGAGNGSYCNMEWDAQYIRMRDPELDENGFRIVPVKDEDVPAPKPLIAEETDDNDPDGDGPNGGGQTHPTSPETSQEPDHAGATNEPAEDAADNRGDAGEPENDDLNNVETETDGAETPSVSTPTEKENEVKNETSETDRKSETTDVVLENATPSVDERSSDDGRIPDGIDPGKPSQSSDVSPVVEEMAEKIIPNRDDAWEKHQAEKSDSDEEYYWKHGCERHPVTKNWEEVDRERFDETMDAMDKIKLQYITELVEQGLNETEIRAILVERELLDAPKETENETDHPARVVDDPVNQSSDGTNSSAEKAVGDDPDTVAPGGSPVSEQNDDDPSIGSREQSADVLRKSDAQDLPRNNPTISEAAKAILRAQGMLDDEKNETSLESIKRRSKISDDAEGTDDDETQQKVSTSGRTSSDSEDDGDTDETNDIADTLHAEKQHVASGDDVVAESSQVKKTPAQLKTDENGVYHGDYPKDGEPVVEPPATKSILEKRRELQSVNRDDPRGIPLKDAEDAQDGDAEKSDSYTAGTKSMTPHWDAHAEAVRKRNKENKHGN